MEELGQYNKKTDNEFLKFINTVKKVNIHRIHTIKNSYGIYDGFKFYRKNKPKEHKYILNESQYFAITRKINKLLGESLINGEDILLPFRLGRLEIRKYKPRISIDGQKIRTNFPIDWNRTLQLWYEDKESYKNKTLVKMEEKEIYKIYYNRNIADFTNKTFYQFDINRQLKKQFKQNIKQGNIDAFLLKRE